MTFGDHHSGKGARAFVNEAPSAGRRAPGGEGVVNLQIHPLLADCLGILRLRRRRRPLKWIVALQAGVWMMRLASLVMLLERLSVREFLAVVGIHAFCIVRMSSKGVDFNECLQWQFHLIKV